MSDKEYGTSGGGGQAPVPEVEDKLSLVAASRGKNIGVLIVVGVLVCYILYLGIFSGGSDESEQDQRPERVASSPNIPAVRPPDEEVASALEEDTSVPADESMIQLPELKIPEPPQPPKPELSEKTETVSEELPPPLPDASIFEKDEGPSEGAPPPPATESSLFGGVLSDEPKPTEEARRVSIQEKRGTPMIISGGNGGASFFDSYLGRKKRDSEKSEATRERESLFEGGIEYTSSESVRVTRIGPNPGFYIAQGKIIDAVLETAINTDLEGQLRAIVSRDVYAEAGKNILIPKGSRLIGSYSSGDVSTIGQRRVEVIWNRVIRPDGLDIAIESPGIDQLGRQGVEGLVNNRYTELFGNSLLLSTISVSFALLAETVLDDSNSVTQQSTGSSGTSTTEISSPSTTAVNAAVQSLDDVAKQIATGYLNTQPTIMVDQGTRVKVFVNKDIVFPESIAGGARILQ